MVQVGGLTGGGKPYLIKDNCGHAQLTLLPFTGPSLVFHNQARGLWDARPFYKAPDSLHSAQGPPTQVFAT